MYLLNWLLSSPAIIFLITTKPGALTDFTSSLSAVSYVYDFPKAGDIVELEWETVKQSFTARRSFRNALDEGFTVVRFNRSSLGHGISHVSNDDGFFRGRFSLTPNGSQESYKDVVIGIAK